MHSFFSRISGVILFSLISVLVLGCGDAEFRSKLIYEIPEDPSAGGSGGSATVNVGDLCSSSGGMNWTAFDESKGIQVPPGTPPPDGLSRPYIICSARQIVSYSVATLGVVEPSVLSLNFQLNADVDFSGLILAPIAPVPGFPYQGTFDGNGYSIRNLSVRGIQSEPLGLFSQLGSDGALKNFRLIGASVGTSQPDPVASPSVGAVAGVSSGTIQNVRVENSTIVGSMNVGGVVGQVGSLVNPGPSVVKSCAVRNSTIQGQYVVGGLVGYLGDDFQKMVSICEVTGTTIKALPSIMSMNSVGGIVGRLNGASVSDCRAESNLIGESANSYTVGGLVGEIMGGGAFVSGAVLKYSYSATSTILGKQFVGGIVGRTPEYATIHHIVSANTLIQSDDPNAGQISGNGNDYLDPSPNGISLTNLYYSNDSECSSMGQACTVNSAWITQTPKNYVQLLSAAEDPYVGINNHYWEFHDGRLPTPILFQGASGEVGIRE